MQKNRVWKLLFATSVSIILLWLIFRQISLRDILTTYRQIPFSLILLGSIIFTLSHGIRTIRFNYLLGKKISHHDMFAIVCMHNLILNLLPFRMGEFSISYFLKERKVKVTTSLGMLAVGRIFDLIVIMLLFLIALLMVWNELPPFLHPLRMYTILLFLILSSLVYFMVAHFQRIVRKLNNKKRSKLLSTLLEKLHDIAESFQILKQRHGISIVLALTLLIWILQFAWTYLVFTALLQTSLWTIIIGSALPILATAIPVQGVGNFGTMEGVWGMVFIAFGIEETLAFASGFVFHILAILYALVLAVYGFIVFYSKKA